MRIPAAVSSITLTVALFIAATIVQADQEGKPVFGRDNPSKYVETKNCHHGPGSLKAMTLLGQDIFETNIYFFSKGILEPKCGIGEHIHRDTEEMFFIFGGPAEFTVNGHTALLPSGSCVACPMGTSHGVYNNSDKTLVWMDIAATKIKGKFDSIEYSDSLTTQTLESPAPFAWAQFDRSLLKPTRGAHG